MNPFALAYREQQQLFMYDKAYLLGTLFKTGGLAALLAQFVVQFFHNPTIALSLTLSLLALSSYLLWLVLRRDRKDWRIVPLCIVPACFMGASLSDNSLHFDFLTSLLLVEAGLLLFKKIRSCKTFWGVSLTVILYLTAGPSAVLFSVCAAFMDKSWKSLCFPVAVLVCGLVAYLTVAVPTWGEALTPAFYYDLDARMPAVHWGAWIAIASVAAISLVTGVSREKKYTKGVFAASCVLLLAALVGTHLISGNIEKESSLTSYEYEYYTVNGRWDDLIGSCRRHAWTPGTANYLNLALAHKGTLVKDLFKYDQRGTSSLIFIPQEKTVDVRIAHIMYAMGNIAAAQDVAFNALNSMTGYSPAMLKMNAEIELMRGTYDVADKYLCLLKKAPHYSKWAKERSHLLWNDEAVLNDPLLGTGRRDFPYEDGFSMFGSPIDELSKVIEANPSDSRAMQYYLSFLLLAKDIERLSKFVDRYWGAPALSELPVAVQEALLFYSEYTRNFGSDEPLSLEWCMDHGVTAETMERFRAFQNASLQSKGSSPAGFRTTYWNYLLYTEI